MGYISYKEECLEKGNSILIGGKTMVVTYQPVDFFSNDSHNLVLSLKDSDEGDEDVYLFLVASIKKALSHKYHWGDSISKQKIKSDSIKVPLNTSGNIDYQHMRDTIKSVKKMIIANLKAFIARELAAYEGVENVRV